MRKDYFKMTNGYAEWCKDLGYDEFSLQAYELWEIEFSGVEE